MKQDLTCETFYVSIIAVLWFKTTPTDGDLDCGTIIHWQDQPTWKATAFDEYSKAHYFSSEAEAEKWLTTNWCKP